MPAAYWLVMWCLLASLSQLICPIGKVGLGKITSPVRGPETADIGQFGIAIESTFTVPP